MRKMKRRFGWLSVDELSAALNYQRDIDEGFVRDKVKNFDENEIDVPCISLRIKIKDEKEIKEYKIVDGQHTIAILRGVGEHKVYCEIREGLTIEEENEWFYIKNTKKRSQTSNRLLNAKCNGKFDKITNKLIESLDSVGYKIKTIDVKGGKGVIKAGLTIENIFKNMNELNFKKCMALHSSVWQGDRKSMTAPFLKGMNKFYITYGEEIDAKRFIHVFLNKKITANDIIKDVSKSELKKDSNIKYAWVLVDHYNTGLAESKKLKFSKLVD